jgi:Catalase
MYPDTQRYRLGANNHQLPCNEPKHYVANYQRAGTASYISQGNRPNYEGSIRPLCFTGPKNAIDSQINNNYRHEKFIGTVDRFLSEVDDGASFNIVDRHIDQNLHRGLQSTTSIVEEVGRGPTEKVCRECVRKPQGGQVYRNPAEAEYDIFRTRPPEILRLISAISF